MLHKALKRTKAKLLRFKQTDKPILVLGLRRGGSTMVTDAISCNPGIWFADEPYAMFPNREGFEEKSKRLHIPKHSHYFGLDKNKMDEFSEFTKDLLSAKFRTMGTSRKTLAGFRANRTCLKILNAPWMIDWFSSNTSGHILSVIRHPGAQAKSVLRQGWGYPVEAYLERQNFLEPYFSAKQLNFCENIFKNGNFWQKAVLDWVITSHPLRQHSNNNLLVKYEDIVISPEKFTDDVLIKEFNLTDREAMINSFLKPSGSSKMNTKESTSAIQLRDLDKIIDGWRDSTNSEELIMGQDILDAFSVSEYRFTKN